MLTFLELYQTMLGFVFFKIYADAGLVYPPPLDTSKDEAGAGVDAFSLQDSKQPTVSELPTAKPVATTGKKVSGKDVRQAIKAVATSAPADVSMSVEDDAAPAAAAPADEQFVLQPSKLEQEQGADLPTLQTLAAAPQTDAADLFAGCVFWLSREVPRPILEFVLRSMGARVGWPATSGGGSPIDETDPAITHVIVDRPLVERASETADERQLRLGRKFVQPQWVADSVNAGRRLLEAHYAQGAALPPHLSPFETYAGGYDPTAVAEDAEMSDAEEAEEAEEAEAEDTPAVQAAAAVAAAVADADENPAALRAAELEAEAAGVDFGAFEKEVAKSRKKSKAGKTAAAAAEPAEDDMNKMLMSNKQRKLYERMKYGQRKQAAEVRSAICLGCVLRSHHLPGVQVAGAKSGVTEGEAKTVKGEGLESLHLLRSCLFCTCMSLVCSAFGSPCDFFAFSFSALYVPRREAGGCLRHTDRGPGPCTGFWRRARRRLTISGPQTRPLPGLPRSDMHSHPSVSNGPL
jgi:pescadillo protein